MESANLKRFVVTLLVVGALTFTGVAMADFVVDYANNASSGALSNNASVFLGLCNIDESDWYGNKNYNAYREDSTGSITFADSIIPSGSDSFATTGDVLRSSIIQRGGYTAMTSWYVYEYSQGGC